jgi:glycosyltransferase involved in cell wall biosynthesis
MLDEHFGIAIAEMMTAGCIVFSHNSGGPPEILNDDRQLYDDVEEGVRIISHTVSSPTLQSELHENARPLGLRYSPASFCGSIRAEIETFKKSERA